MGFNSFAIFSTIVSWGLVADHWKNINNSNGGDFFKRGPAFALVVTAFVLMVVALALYVLVWRIESVGYSKSGDSVADRRATQVEDNVEADNSAADVA